MALELTTRAQAASQQKTITPNLVIEIDGLAAPIGSVVIDTAVEFGTPGLVFGGGAVFGGVTTISDQHTLISLTGSSTTIQQQLNPDKGAGSSVTSMQIAFVDLNGYMTDLISPGFTLDDLLGRKAIVWLGFDGTSFKEDYIIIHRGIISQIDSAAGLVTLDISSPDQKKRQQIFPKVETTVSGGTLLVGDTTVVLSSSSNLLQKVQGPDGSYDDTFRSYVRIDDEIIQYDTISGNSLLGCTRGALGTTASAHDNGSTVDSFYRLTGNVIDLAVKIMMSSWQGPFIEDLDIRNFVSPDQIEFVGDDVAEIYGLVIGDYITTSGASNGANNVSLKQITAITHADNGVSLTIDDVSFVNETDSAGVMSVRSQYDTLPDGLQMGGDEVDVDEHLRIQRIFLSSTSMDFYLKDTLDTAKDFIENELYNPCAAYSVPRKGKASVGFTSGPIPAATIKTIDLSNTIKPSGIVLRRGLAKNFYNTIVYKFDDLALDDKFVSGVISTDATSRTRIPVGTRALTIESKGLRSSLNGVARATSFATRRLNRYKFAAEYIEQINVLYGDSFNIEIGDVVLLDNADMYISNTATGVRSGGTNYYEVVNKSLDIKTGNVKLSIVNTNYSNATRGSLISPSSTIISGASTTQFTITQTGNSVFGSNEGGKWSRYTLPAVKVVSSDYTTRNDNSIITAVSGNIITVSPALSFTPQAGDILLFDTYNNCTDMQHAVYGFMGDGTFDDGTSDYTQI